MNNYGDFDPYQVLVSAVKQIESLAESHRNLAQLVKETTELQKHMVQRINEQTEAINGQHITINQLHGRIRLLETVRQYEQETDTSKNTNNH